MLMALSKGGVVGRTVLAVPVRCGSGFQDDYFPAPRPANKGHYQPKKANSEAWQIPARREYALTQAMAEEQAARVPVSISTEPDVFPHPHTLEGNFRHIQYPQDARFPSWVFDGERSEFTKDPNKPARDNFEIGYKFQQGLTWAGFAMLGAYAAKGLVLGIVDAKMPTREKYVLGSTEVNTGAIPEGKSQTFLWRGKPVFVRHRTEKQIAVEREVNHTELRDPEPDSARCSPGKDKWVIMIGVCTHLGCIPVANAGDYNGYYCPCHGSHYDTGGRIRKGPAPLNLEIPAHEWTDDNTIVIGKV